MAVNIEFDLLNNPEPSTLILANRNGNKLGQLHVNPKSIGLIDRLSEASEISFTVNKYVDGKITNLWDKLVDFKLVYCKEWDCWFEARVELDEATESVKTVFCTQLGQAELSQIMLYDIEINTEADIERDDYKIGILYDPIDSQCILGRLLEKAPHYSIIHVDNSIANIQRSFSFDGTSVYDAFQEIAEEIGCLFVFNSDSDENGMPRRTISVYDLQQSCNNDGCLYRGEFTDKCPKCGGTDITYGYGEDTSIFVTSDELASNGIQLVTDTDSVKNCFKLEAGDDLMTATIRNRNPNGTDYIWYFSDATKEDMPKELVEKIESYDETYRHYYDDYESNLDSNLLTRYNELVDKYLIYNKDLEKINNPIKGFSSLMNAYYNTIDLGWYLKSGLMPDVNMGKTNAEEQASLLSVSLPTLIGIANLKTVSKATADSSVLMMAKAVVNSHYKVTIKSSSLSSGNWTGVFTVTNYSDEEDTYTTNTISRSLVDWDETYIQQKIDKMLSKENTDDLSITGLFANDYSDFCKELKKYALIPLTSFHDACQACLDILIEQGAGSSSSDLYDSLYVPYYNKLKAIESEMAIREDEVNDVLGEYDVNGKLLADGLQTNIEDIKVQIQDKLNFEKYLGKDLWLQFCAYRREDKYQNENYISDGLNNAELFQKALEFYKVAENEIFKSAELQHSITATLNNLLAIPKFKSLVKSFEVGNWIRVQIDEVVYKLRLVEYEISYDDFDNISVKFSDVAKTRHGYSDLEDILSDASSMASSYDSIKRQANSGDKARDMIRQWLNEGLDASLVQIQNNTNEDIVIDNNGLLGRSYSDIMSEYSPEQIKLTHNIIAFTDDNWATVKQAIGKHKYRYFDEGKDEFVDTVGYGVSADFVTAGIVSGSQIIGGNIYSYNYSPSSGNGSYINLVKGDFSFGGGALRFEIDETTEKGKLIISSDPTSTNVTELNDEWLKTTNITAQNLSVNAANINGKLVANQIDTNGLNVNVAKIGNWNVATGGTDSGSLFSDDGIYRAWIHTPSSGTWVYSIQKAISGSDQYQATFYAETSGDVYAAGDINVDGYIYGNYKDISAEGNISGTNVYGNYIHSNGNIDVVGNISANGNISGGSVTASGDIDCDDIDCDQIYCSYIQSSGNMSALGDIYATNGTGNIYGNYIHSNGDINANGNIYASGDIDGNRVFGDYVQSNGDIGAVGNIIANGTKNRLVGTKNYGQRLLYCYETPSPMFGDIGEGQLDELGRCYIFLDDVFAETIDTDCIYQVFLQPYGKGECYVAERTSSYFVVEGTENLSFGWEIKAIQKDYDTTRLEEFDIKSVESEKV